MSWLSGIVGKAEDLLNQVDQTAAVALQKNESNSHTGTNFISNISPHHSHISPLKNSYQTASNYVTPEFTKPYISPSVSLKKTSPASLKPVITKSDIIEKDDEKLLEYLNSNETAFVPRKLPSSPKEHSLSTSVVMLQADDAKVTLNQSEAEAPSCAEDCLADTMGSVEEKSDVPISEETIPLKEKENISEENIGSTVSKAALEVKENDHLVQSEIMNTQPILHDAVLEKENELLKNEIKSLSQEIESVTQKNKDIESEMRRMQRKLDHWNSQVSNSDHLIRELQERESDLNNALNAKDSQLAVLRVRLQEADQELQVKRSMVEKLSSENERILQDHNNSYGLHNQTLDSLKERLRETDTSLQREKTAYKALQAENMERFSRLEDEQRKLIESLTSAQKALSEEKAQNKDLSSQMKLATTNLEALKQEFSEYKQKAQRILQSKEKIIASLKEAQSGSQEIKENVENSTNFPAAIAEIEMLHQECETLQEELQSASKHSENLQLEIQEMERIAQSEMESCHDQVRVLEEQLKQEQQQRISLEQECSQQREELRYFHEDFARTKSNLQSRIQDRDSEIEKLRKQLTTKSLSNTSQSELEARLHSLTESLIQKQTVVEALSTEKSSLVLQLERLEQQLRDCNVGGSHRQNTVVGIDGPECGERYRPNSGYFLASPYDGPLARKMKRVYGIIDSFSIRSGVFLRRYPMARIFVIAYMFVLHLWVTLVLLTYKPEVHGPHYNIGRT